MFTSIHYDTKKSPDVSCLHQAVVLSHSLSGMLVSQAFGGHLSTGVDPSSSQRPHLASQRRVKWLKSGRAGVVCSAEMSPIKLIATDVDGTLLNSKQELTPAVEQAVKKAADLGVPVLSCVHISPDHRRGSLQSLLHVDVGVSFKGSFLMQLVVATGKAPGCAWTGRATPMASKYTSPAGSHAAAACCPARHCYGSKHFPAQQGS